MKVLILSLMIGSAFALCEQTEVYQTKISSFGVSFNKARALRDCQNDMKVQLGLLEDHCASFGNFPKTDNVAQCLAQNCKKTGYSETLICEGSLQFFCCDS